MASPDHVMLADGRRLDVRVSGPTDGVPLVFHHGTPGSAVPYGALERAAHQRGLRLITTSRPGYGDSDRHRGRSVVDVSGDTAQVLAALGAERCLVAGWSGGGPHALADAARLDGAAAALVMAGVAPLEALDLDWWAGMGEDNVAEFETVLRGEVALRDYLDALRPHLKDVTVDGMKASLATLLPEVDQTALTDEFGHDMAAIFRQALRSGVDGWLDDDLAFAQPWGFDLDEIAIPTSVWQGSADLMVPFAHGQWLATHVPGVATHLEQEEGHLSLVLGAIDRMLDELVVAGGLG